jgi:tRNA dimethylallyltransferase
MVAKVAPLIVVLGETASGKSALGMDLARQFNGEIICADSRTIYTGMDIGTAKPSRQDRAEIPHHLLDVIKPGQKYSAAQFKQDAERLITEIASRGRLPIMVGGTGLYIDAVIFNYQFSTKDAPRSSENSRHLDISVASGKGELRDNTLLIGLSIEREALEARIRSRIENMFAAGFETEVSDLVAKYGNDDESTFGIGYRVMFKYLHGDVTLEEAKEEFVRGDKSLAKRQRTWFKRNKSIHWVTKQSEAVELVTTLLKQN